MPDALFTSTEVRTILGLKPLDEHTIQHIAVSEKPWSDYSEADYSIEQWHAASLIHNHDGAPTSKAQCKLPVRTPDGTLSRNGVHAAAGALAGARGGVMASPDQKRSAARAILRCYDQLNEKAPPSMGAMMQSQIDNVKNFLSHVLVGDGNSRGSGGGKFDEGKVKRDKGGMFATKAESKALDQLWLDKDQMMSNVIAIGVDPKIGDAMDEMLVKLGAQYGMTDPDEVWDDPRTAAKAFSNSFDLMNEAIPNYVEGVSPSGTKRLMVFPNGDSDFVVRSIPYSGPNPHAYVTRTLLKDSRYADRLARRSSGTSSFHFNPDAVLDPSRVHSASDPVDAFLAQSGIRGMKWGVTRSRGPGGTVGSGLPGGHAPAAPKASSSSGHPSGEAAALSDHERAREIKLKAQREGVKSLSNAEVQLLVNRMNLQKQYSQLTAKPSTFEKGRDFVNHQLKTGKTLNDMIKFANSPAGNLLASSLRPAGVGKHLQGKHAVGVPRTKF